MDTVTLNDIRDLQKKRVANWLGSPKRVIHQLIVSSYSYLTYPFAKFHENAAKEYFTQIYSVKDDPLLFDGKDEGYLQKIVSVMEIQKLTKKRVLDIGCGNGNLFQFLESKGARPLDYIGIDFAHPSVDLAENANITKIAVREYEIKSSCNPTTIFIINTLCYLDDSVTKSILESTHGNFEIVIIEPIPSIFWDSHFDGVRLYYRNPNDVVKMLIKANWAIKAVSIDYGIRVLDKHLFPLSCCIYARALE